jgi:hypothetical protein
MKHVKPLITLALACLLAVPAIAMPTDGNAGRGGMFDQLGLTEEQKATMTLGELKDLAKDQNQNNQPRLNGAMGPQGNMPGMASANGCNMMGAQGPQGNQAGMAGANGCNMMGAQGPQGNQAGMAGANGCNMMGAQGPQGNMPGMAGACPQQQGMGAGCMNAPGSDAQGPKL